MKRYRQNLGQLIDQYFSDRANDTLPLTKLPPPPMPTVRPPKCEGYTAQELRNMTVPREDLIFQEIMEECKRVAVELGQCYLVLRDHGFNQNPLPSITQRVFDRLVANQLECTIKKFNSSCGPRSHVLIKW